jgi:hypothetical protein
LVDSTDLIIIASVIQTVVITLTLAVFIFQFRSQEKSIREAAVQAVMGRYTDFVKMTIDKPELSRLRSYMETLTAPEGSRLEKLSPEDEMAYSYILLGYGIFEEVFLLHKKKWIDEETWQQWAAFLERISRHPLFKRVYSFSAGTFDRDFENHVSKLVGKKD